MGSLFSTSVTPAQAGGQMTSVSRALTRSWIPAFAGMTVFGYTAPAHAATGEAVNPWVALAYLVSGKKRTRKKEKKQKKQKAKKKQ